MSNKIELTNNTILIEPSKKINLQEIRQKLSIKCAHKPKYEANCILTDNYLTCSFLDKTLFITDDKFNPLLMYESTSYITACGISRSGKYIVCQTARNNENDNDSNTTILFDTTTRQEIARKKDIETGTNSTRLIFIDEYKQLIQIYVADAVLGEGNNFAITYDFNLCANEDTLRKFYTKPDISPYTLNNRAIKLIDRLQINIQDKDLQELTELLNRLKLCKNISPLQLSLTYKSMGNMYEKHNLLDNAILAYETGLTINPKLTVKKALKNLKYNSCIKEHSDKIQKQLKEESTKKNNIYDEEWENELNKRLSKLDEPSRKAFYHMRANRKEDNILSYKELDILNLEALERSYNYHKKN